MLNNGYKGGAFHPQLPKGKAGGIISVSGAALEFRSENLSFQLPLEGLEIKIGGTGGRLIFFSHPDHPEKTVYSRNQKILSDPQFKSRQMVQRQRKSAQLHLFKQRAWAFFSCMLILVILSSAYLLKDPAVSLVVKRLPPDFENSLGENFIKQYRSTHDFIESTVVEEKLNHLVKPLITVIASNRYDFKFYIVQDSSLNAFALPGGHIVINTGLILSASRSEEILGVIAHEIAHVTRQHGVRKVLESTSLYIVLSGLFGDVSGITAVFLSNGTFLLQQQFSREFEREADLLAVTYLNRTAIDPSGLYDFFAKLKEKEAAAKLGGFSESITLLSTHPATDRRMESLQKAIDEKGDESYRPVEFDLKAFQALLYEASGDI